jgi:uncharacterized protein (TIGR04255 family)
MPINFPDKLEVQLVNPPLEEVVCQVRFPILLRIAKEEPIELQERIRDRFPYLEWGQGVQLQLPGPGIKAEPLAEIQPKIYRFKTSDEETAVSLAPDFYAVTTNNYTHWQEFADALQFAHKAVLDTYNLPYATRIGLRYINRLTLHNTNSQTKNELFSLVCSELTALLQGEVWQDTDSMSSLLVFSDDSAQLNCRIIYEEVDGLPNFVLDFDYFEKGKLPLEGLIERCDNYHKIIYNAFRWSLCDESLDRFQPIKNEEQK